MKLSNLFAALALAALVCAPTCSHAQASDTAEGPFPSRMTDHQRAMLRGTKHAGLLGDAAVSNPPLHSTRRTSKSAKRKGTSIARRKGATTSMAGRKTGVSTRSGASAAALTTHRVTGSSTSPSSPPTGGVGR